MIALSVKCKKKTNKKKHDSNVFVHLKPICLTLLDLFLSWHVQFMVCTPEVSGNRRHFAVWRRAAVKKMAVCVFIFCSSPFFCVLQQVFHSDLVLFSYEDSEVPFEFGLFFPCFSILYCRSRGSLIVMLMQNMLWMEHICYD